MTRYVTNTIAGHEADTLIACSSYLDRLQPVIRLPPILLFPLECAGYEINLTVLPILCRLLDPKYCFSSVLLTLWRDIGGVKNTIYFQYCT